VRAYKYKQNQYIANWIEPILCRSFSMIQAIPRHLASIKHALKNTSAIFLFRDREECSVIILSMLYPSGKPPELNYVK